MNKSKSQSRPFFPKSENFFVSNCALVSMADYASIFSEYAYISLKMVEKTVQTMSRL